MASAPLPDTTAEVISDPKSTEEGIIVQLLDEIHLRTSNDDAEIFRYLFGALLPQNNITKISDGYKLLRQSEIYYHSALSLVYYMVQGHGSKKEMDRLKDIIDHSKFYEADIRHERLNLRRMLSNIVDEMKDETTVRELVYKTSVMINQNTDHIKSEKGQFGIASALNAFRLLEENGELDPMLGECEKALRKYLPLNLLLEGIGQPKLNKKYVETFQPHRPITLAIMKVERLKGERVVNLEQCQEKDLADYKKCVVTAYNAMSIIESNQWPPVKDHFYINLALITSDYLLRTDTFSRATIRGSVDDIHKRKESITFSDIFPDRIGSEKHHVTLLEGRPGSGKSTLITKVSKDWAEGKILEDIKIFILIRLRRFVGKQDLDLMDLLGMYCSNPRLVKAMYEEVTRNSGKGVCFAFDGLDEYSSKLTTGNIVTKLISGHELSRATIFMTSRPATSERFRRKTILTQHVEIIGFLEKEINDYIKSYYKDNIGEAIRLITYIDEHPNIGRMCYLPLHIAMVVFLHDLDPIGYKYLPQTETDLYTKFTTHTLYRSLMRDPDEDYDPDDVELHHFNGLPNEKKRTFEKMCKLAYDATVSEKQIFTGKEIIETAALPEVPKKREFDSLGLLTVDRMIADSSLLTTTFSFLHLTHQEFLSAIYLVYHQSDEKKLGIIKTLASKVHMWVVWKFFCGLYAEKREKLMIHQLEEKTALNSTFSGAFNSIIADNVSSHLACLSMMHCAFESQYEVSCSDLLTLLRGVIDVTDIALNPSDCSALGYVFVHAPNKVKEVDFSYCHLGPAGIAAFVRQLEKLQERSFSEAEILRLRARTDHKPVGSKGAKDLIKLLNRLPNLGELRLYGNKLRSNMFKELAPAISKLNKIHTLILSRNDLEVDTAPMVSEVLANLPKLHTFYVSYNPLTGSGLCSMKPGLLKCENLKIVGLRGTHLGEDAGVHLSDILSTLPKLEWIELYQNKLGSGGVEAMIPGLKQAKSLKMISLVENGISDSGALALAEYLSITNTLEVMRIYYNHDMTDVGKIALRSAVVERPNNLCSLGLAV